ncbi:hypothetical protein ACFSHQ_21235 [Gemmobacter lanyuensis]
MLRDMDRSFVLSGAGHLVLILWVLFGDFLFSPPEPEEMTVTSVSMISSAEFDAMMSGAAAPSETQATEDPAAEALPDTPPPPRPNARPSR